MIKKPVIKFCFLFLACIFLIACDRNSELKKLGLYIADVKAKPSRSIEPLPEIKQYKNFAYNDQNRRSPFQPYQRITAKGEQPNMGRPKHPLEAFPLDSLRMVGTLRKQFKVWALVRAPDGTVYQVTKGDYVGKNFGKINAVTREKVDITESVTEQGTWKKRPASMRLNESTLS